MKKVRNLLILLLAAMTLTVFVGCSGDTPEPEPKGGLFISKYYIGPSTKDFEGENALEKAPEGFPWVGGNTKFFAIKNTSENPIDLSSYSIGIADPADETYTNVTALPKMMLAAGATLYIPNEYGVNDVAQLIPALLTLPEAKDDAVIAGDAYFPAKAYYNGSRTIEIVKDVVEKGKTEPNSKGETYPIYSWTKVDEILIDGDVPGRHTTAIRVFNDNNKPTGWSSYGWSDPAVLPLLNPAKGSVNPYNFADFKAEFDANNGNPAELPKLKYGLMDDAMLAEFKTAAIAAGWKDVYISKGDIYIVTEPGVIYNQYSGTKWDKKDYTFATFLKNFNDNKLGKYPKYNYMPTDYVETFKTAAAGWTITIDAETKTFSAINEAELKQAVQVDGAWTELADGKYASKIADYKANGLPEDEVLADMTKMQEATIQVALKEINKQLETEKTVYSFAIDAAKRTSTVTIKKDVGDKYVIKTITQDPETMKWASKSVDEPKEESKPDSKPTPEPEKPVVTVIEDGTTLKDGDLVVSEVYLGKNKYFAITNFSENAVSLKDYWYCKGKSVETNDERLYLPAGASLASGKTIYVINSTKDTWEANCGISAFATMPSIDKDTTGLIETDVTFKGNFNKGKANNMYFGKKGAEEALNLTTTTWTFFIRNFDKTTNKSVSWDSLKTCSSDKPDFKLVGDWVNWHILN